MNIVDKIINIASCGLWVFIAVLPINVFFVMNIIIFEQYGHFAALGFTVCLFIFAEAYSVIRK